MEKIIDEQLEEMAREDIKQQYPEVTANELTETIGLTIKRDVTNKLITFMGMLSAYTENSQLNISYNAPSSTGKSYIPSEVAKLFPSDDVIQVGYCSPTAFFHDVGKFNKERGGYVVDLEKKILIFLDQPHQLLLQHLRPLLSHDKKEIQLKITDKSQKHGLKTKNIFVIGYPAVIFCTAGLKIDEQEATRFFLLSPETNQEKIREAIYERIRRETDSTLYNAWLEENPERRLLKERIQAIKDESIGEINIGNPAKLQEMFLKDIKIFKPRHQRDISRVISLVKSFAFLNLWHRDSDGNAVITNDRDIVSAFNVWNSISEAQEHNLPPYIYNLCQDVILTAYENINSELLATLLLQQEFLLHIIN